MARFAQLIKERRRQAMETQAEFAARIGRSPSWVAAAEVGRLVPKPDETPALAQSLGVDALEVLTAILLDRNLGARGRAERDLSAWEGASEDLLAVVGAEQRQQEQDQDPNPITRVGGRSYDEIERAAEQIVERSFPDALLGRASPRVEELVDQDPDHIGRALGVAARVRIQTDAQTPARSLFEPSQPEASTRFVDDAFVITLRSDVLERLRDPGRARFTFAHELGHVVLHGHVLKSQQAAAFRDFTATARYQRPEDVPAYACPEWQANAFAAALLMPRDAVREYIRTLPAPHEVDASAAELVADRFRVSAQAATLRLDRLLRSQLQR